MSEMTIYVGTQVDRCTFELEPRSRQRLNARRTDEGSLPRSVFIGCDTEQDCVQILGRDELRWTIAEILTGMEREELNQIGQVEFRDPTRNLALFDPAA
ncbi:MAG: hypothetical protein OXH52_12170 [Gammaproteobacteria bacterium]|nr:hypothetical protein [Gammaproteobacteria bacterium]